MSATGETKVLLLRLENAECKIERLTQKLADERERRALDRETIARLTCESLEFKKELDLAQEEKSNAAIPHSNTVINARTSELSANPASPWRPSRPCREGFAGGTSRKASTPALSVPSR